MLNLDLKKAEELVGQAIAEKGKDFVYQQEDEITCLYVHGITDVWNDRIEDYEKDLSGATTGCLVGHALKLGGIPLEAMEEKNDMPSNTLLDYLEEKGFVTVTDHARSFLSNLQSSQDSGAPWEMAASAAAKGHRLEPTFNTNGEKTGNFRRVL